MARVLVNSTLDVSFIDLSLRPLHIQADLRNIRPVPDVVITLVTLIIRSR